MPRLVEVINDEPRLDLRAPTVAALCDYLDTTVSEWSIPRGDLSVRFVDEATCRRLHADFFDDPTLTDVMTFPGDPEDDYAGDLAICPAYAVESAPAHGLSLAEELTLYLIHGWLHLAGLDDRSEATVLAMRKAESTVMRRLRADRKIPAFAWQANEAR